MVINLKQNTLGDILNQINPALAQLAEKRQEQQAAAQKQNLIQSILNGTGGQVGRGEIIHPGETADIDIENDITERNGITKEQVNAMALVDPQRAALLESQRKGDLKESAEIKKRNLALFDETTKQVNSIEEELNGLNQLSKLSNAIGKKQNQNSVSRFFRSFRFDPETGGFTRIGKATASPEEERFIKLIADQTKTIKNDYGARITNLDMEVFLRRFPDLMMTAQGRNEILDTLKDYREGKLLYNKALKNQLRVTKGKVDPYTLDERIEKQIGPKLDKIRKKIENRGFSQDQQDVQVSEKVDILGGGEEEQATVTAINPQTGQKIMLKEGKWVPFQ